MKSLDYDPGTICTIVGLQKRRDLNGQRCTVKSSLNANEERIAVTVTCDGKEVEVLVKKENLLVHKDPSSLISQSFPESALENTMETMKNTAEDVNEFMAVYQKLIDRLEEAIYLRNSGKFILAINIFTELIGEAEELCGKNSFQVATFLKSYALLLSKLEWYGKAEVLLTRADAIRPADSEGNNQGTHTMMHLFDVQVMGRRINKAEKTLKRIRMLKHCIRPGVDIGLRELEISLEEAKVTHPSCMSCGRLQTKLSTCSRCHSAVYCSLNCQKKHWETHKHSCKSFVTLENSSSDQPRRTLRINADSSHNTTQAMEDSDPLANEILHNARATSIVSPSSPTELNSSLIAALADPQKSYFFAMNDVTSSILLERDGGRRRFLATTGVLSCINVFAWSPATDPNGLGHCVGCHVFIGALFRGLRACRHTKQDIDRALAPLVSQLRNFGTSAKNVVVTLMGGHRAMDKDDALVEMFPGDNKKWSFAWHVKNACEAALDSVSDKITWNTKLLLRFEGERIKDCDMEEQVRRKNMIFLVAALDTVSGNIITHTRYTNIDTILTSDVLIRQRRAYYGTGDFFLDPKLRVVSHKDEIP